MDKKWNLQDIKPAKRAPRATRQPAPVEESPRVEEYEPPRERERERVQTTRSRPKRSHLTAAIIVFLLIVGVGIGIGVLTSGAKVTVYPRWREPVLNAALEAKKQAAAGELAYEVMTFEAEGDRTVRATGEETVTEQAKGKLTISKSTSGSERLIKNTRFATPDGLVFRITESAVVPGATTDSAGKTVPGTVTADVFADEAGPKYNVAAGTKFSVPGFKENNLTELYNAISAENPSAMTGGYDGPRYIIADEELKAALDSLRSEMKEALQKRVAAEKPAGFTVFSTSYTYSYTSLPSEAVGEGNVKIKEKVSLKVPAFKDSDLASYIAKGVVPGYEGEPIRVENISGLTFEYIDSKQTEADLAAQESINFRLSGKPKLIWSFDQEMLKKDLAGAPQTALNTVLGGYPAIEKAVASVRPFWRRSFPTETKDITIVESLTAN